MGQRSRQRGKKKVETETMKPENTRSANSGAGQCSEGIEAVGQDAEIVPVEMGLGQDSIRDESGLTHKESLILTERAIRRGWITGPFPTNATTSELEQVEEDEESTLQELVAASAAKGLRSSDDRRIGAAERVIVAMERANIAHRKEKVPTGGTFNQNNLNVYGALPTVQELIQAAISSGDYLKLMAHDRTE